MKMRTSIYRRHFAFAYVLLVAGFTSCSDSRKDLIETARLNGKLKYEWEIVKWCKKHNVDVNWEQVDSSYYAACKTCH